MKIPSDWVTCDGCGLPASPAHIAERLARLELATRYRPIHISVLFVAASPLPRPEDDFYRPPESREFFGPLFEALDIPYAGGGIHGEAEAPDSDAVRLAEFQRRGYYLSYLSECPLVKSDDSIAAAISRLGSTLVRRIQLNYKPRQIALLDAALSPLGAILERAQIPATSFSILDVPGGENPLEAAQFREALASLAPHDILTSEYDRIRFKQP